MRVHSYYRVATPAGTMPAFLRIVMFAVGRWYKIEMLDSRDDKGNPDVSSIHMKVIGVEGPLVKFDSVGREVIVNTHSPVFVRAELQDRKS